MNFHLAIGLLLSCAVIISYCQETITVESSELQPEKKSPKAKNSDGELPKSRNEPSRNNNQTELNSRSLSDASWSTYCGCLQMATTSTDKTLVKACFKGFFRGNAEIKSTLKTYKNKRQTCFTDSKITDEECKVRCNTSEQSLKSFKRGLAR